MPILEVNNLRKIYTTRLGANRVEALKNVSFSVEEGEYVAVMGESGSGKTTLLNILAALDKPTSGEVKLGGRNIAEVKEADITRFRRENLGFVFQDFNLLDTFSIRDNILLPLLRPAILSALIYSFVRAITTVSAIVFLVTPDTRVATAYILNRVEDGEYGVAIAYGSILIVVMLAIIFIFDWLIGESRTSRSKAKNQA